MSQLFLQLLVAVQDAVHLHVQLKLLGQFPLFSPSSITMLIFHGLQNHDSFINRLRVSTLSGGRGGCEKGREKRARVGHITMEACTVNSPLSPQNLTSVPKSFGPDCRCTLICCIFATLQRCPNQAMLQKICVISLRIFPFLKQGSRRSKDQELTNINLVTKT